MCFSICRYTLALTYSSSLSTVTMYINGVKDEECTGIGLGPASLPLLTNAYIGKSQSDADPYLAAQISSIRAYPGALR